MKLSTSLLCLLVGTCSLASTDAETPIWSDEFNNDGPPDPNFWSYDLGDRGWGNSELQMYTSNPENVKVANGKLTIAARRTGHGISSARIKTLSKVTVKYGRIESSIKFPNLANGLWPAFWTLGQNFPSVGWPQCGELDIMEMGNVDGINEGVVNRRVGSAAHWNNFGTRVTYGLYYDPPADLIGEFHNFTMNWTPELVSTYVDDDLIWEIDISEEACQSCTAFHKPHFILLNLAVGGIYTGIYNNQGITAPMPAEYVIDYVRVYENEWTEMGGTYFVPPETLSSCGCAETCTTSVLDQIATDTSGSYSCRDRAIWVMQNLGYDEETACSKVSTEFPSICGLGCDPATCNKVTPTPTINPSEVPSASPTYQPSSFPSASPTSQPSSFPSASPTSSQPSRFPSHAPTLSSSPPSKPSPSDGHTLDCGCGSNCDSNTLNRIAIDDAGPHSCHSRIVWLMDVAEKPETDACIIVSSEFPSICGQGCDPRNCNSLPPTTVEDCGCPNECTSSVLDQAATDGAGVHSCRARINFVMGNYGKSEEEACKQLAYEFPSICGQGCEPLVCN